MFDASNIQAIAGLQCRETGLYPLTVLHIPDKEQL